MIELNEEYSVYSEFDIEKHKKNYVNYLEVVIDRDGKIMYAVPSHQEKLISLACERHNLSREELCALCPREYYLDFLRWLCMQSEACSVWDKFVYFHELTDQQIRSLKMLIMHGLYLGAIPEQQKR